jgi:hypothetical protein
MLVVALPQEPPEKVIYLRGGVWHQRVELKSSSSRLDS